MCNNFFSPTSRHHHFTPFFSLFRTCDKKMNFQIGDKVCCTRNGYVMDKDKEDEAKGKNDDMYESKVKKERLCNGEIFFITQVCRKISLQNLNALILLSFKRKM